ncbi:WSC-domain-containing protein [Punctularia strigosozonata HHB-11173 SS5]|uniref:WSC-domain-containing protein n=1 Tax=Punctularia strigosozonata (strain HHB-11173) TaxID=741275 RepID=R7S4D5_PUNST|nr:WSC-domain-containing protein [Punctularia strigosozonata HHB-11173 SS5]EIN04662.1 WSC-domain-containing protein [Punctularia strigosozonata HHB-11173 SS5]
MSTRPQRPPVSPVGWTTRFECATDVPTRVLADIETLLLDDNAPATCIAACAADGFTFAGVEFSDECHCGTGFAGGVPPQVAPTSNCDMACTGDADQTCGGVWSIEASMLVSRSSVLAIDVRSFVRSSRLPVPTETARRR